MRNDTTFFKANNMECRQKEVINQNLPELIETTRVHTRFIAVLETANILDPAEIENLVKPGIVSSSTARELYKVLQTRVGGYDVLLEALVKTNQSGVVKILKDGELKFEQNENRSYFEDKKLAPGNPQANLESDPLIKGEPVPPEMEADYTTNGDHSQQHIQNAPVAQGDEESLDNEAGASDNLQVGVNVTTGDHQQINIQDGIPPVNEVNRDDDNRDEILSTTGVSRRVVETIMYILIGIVGVLVVIFSVLLVHQLFLVCPGCFKQEYTLNEQHLSVLRYDWIVVTVKSFKEYNRLMNDITPLQKISMSLVLYVPDDWPSDAVMQYSNQIYKLNISGSIDIITLSKILNQTSELQNLFIDNELNLICHFNQGNVNKISRTVPMHLLKLQTLHLRQLSNCSEVLSALAFRLESENKKQVIIENSIFKYTDFPHIKHILSGSTPSLQSLTISSNYISKLISYISAVPYPYLQTLIISNLEAPYNTDYNSIKIVNLKNDFCKKFPNINTLSMSENNYIMSNQMRLLYKCKNLQRLVTGIYFRNDSVIDDIEVQTHLAQLTTAYFVTYFDTCPNPENFITLKLPNSDRIWPCYSLKSVNCDMVFCNPSEYQCFPKREINNRLKGCNSEDSVE